MAGIYVHIPFCRQACHYCDFHFSTSSRLMESVVRAINNEVKLDAAHWPHAFKTVYFGGGTPSMLPPELLQSIISTLGQHVQLDPETEWCLEANPDDCTPATLAAWKAMGITRLSMGIQSFDAGLLAAMNRAHDSDQARQALTLARQAGFEHFSADLIYGQPGQSLGILQDDLARLVEQRPQHISAYLLTIEEGTALHHQVKKGEVIVPQDELAEAHYKAICAALFEAGYEHYEVSNWALPGHRSRHNSAYWKGEPYLGIGPSAHGFTGEHRYWNVAHNPKYVTALEQNTLPRTTETLSTRDRINEGLMTGLRTIEGVSFADLRSLGVNLEQDILPALSPWLASGAAVMDEKGFRLTEQGLLWSDRVASDLFILDA